MEFDFLKTFLLQAARKGDFKSYSHHLNRAVEIRLKLLEWQPDSTSKNFHGSETAS